MLFQSRQNNNSLIQKINDYVDVCKNKCYFHREQAKHSMRWWNLLGVVNVVLTASQALAMTIQASLSESSYSIAITGGVFACFIAIFNRVQMAFAFNCLCLEHHHLADNFNELEQRFLLLINDIEKEEFSEPEYEKCVNRYISINEKTHLQTVYHMKLCFCSCRRRENTST